MMWKQRIFKLFSGNTSVPYGCTVFLIVVSFCGTLVRTQHYDIERDSSIPKRPLEYLIAPPYIQSFLKKSWEPLLFHGLENEVCKAHVTEWFVRARNLSDIQDNKDMWVLHMIDSWGKWSDGILSGHVNALGDFDECVDISVSNLEFKGQIELKTPNNFEGRYCNTFLLPYSENRFGSYFNVSRDPSVSTHSRVTPEAVSPAELKHLMSLNYGVKIAPSFGVCFPNSCEQMDIERILINAFKLVYGEELEANTSDLTWPAVNFCYVGDKPPLDAGDISVIILLGGIAAICFFTTVVDYWFSNFDGWKPTLSGKMYQILMCFSMYTNVPKIVSAKRFPGELSCLHGIRFLSTAWVILTHTWFVLIYMPTWNQVDIKKWHLTDLTFLTILNGTFAVDTFFVIGGLLVAYNVLKQLQRSKGKFDLPMFYLHRYLRITPVYATIIAVAATLVSYTGRGPYWIVMESWEQICENNWWTNMLYVNNLVNTSYLCVGNAWYLATDMQFYVISPLFLLPLYHWETIGIIILSLATLLSIISQPLLVGLLDTDPVLIGTKFAGNTDTDRYYRDVYIRPYARIQTYLIGLWLGYILYKTKDRRIRISLPVVVTLWVLALILGVTPVYGIPNWFDPEYEIPKTASLAYSGLGRFSWGLSVAWMIFACLKGYGGPINDFLSWTAFIPLGRLSYAAYLVSFHLQMLLHVSMKQTMGYSVYIMTNFFFAHMAMSYVVGFMFNALIETPFLRLEGLLLRGNTKKKQKDNPKDNKDSNANEVASADNKGTV